MSQQPNCISCGQFVPVRQMAEGTALFRFTPDNEFGPERIEWLCEDCAKHEEKTDVRKES